MRKDLYYKLRKPSVTEWQEEVNQRAFGGMMMPYHNILSDVSTTLNFTSYKLRAMIVIKFFRDAG